MKQFYIKWIRYGILIIACSVPWDTSEVDFRQENENT